MRNSYIRCAQLAGAQVLSYGLITLNMRAIASRNFLWTGLTDVVLAMLSFRLIKLVGEAKSHGEWLSYIVGGVIGAQCALYFATF